MRSPSTRGVRSALPPSSACCRLRNKAWDFRHLFQQLVGPVHCAPLASKHSAPMLAYVASAFDAYAGVPILGHVHSVTAHGRPIALGPWLDALLARHPHTAFIALGDHGPRGGAGQSKAAKAARQAGQARGASPQRAKSANPFLSLSLPDTFLRGSPRAAGALAQNVNRMVTMYDVYASVRQLAAAGGVLGQPLSAMRLPHIPAKARSLFEIIEATWSCASVGALVSCICDDPKRG